MDEMMRYIFGSLRRAETNMSAISKVLTKQKKLNNLNAAFAVLVTLHAIDSAVRMKVMYDEITNLKKEIEELKNTEGD